MTNNLQIIEHQSERVLTTQQLAEGYETETRRISENFNANKDRYEQGKHFYLLEGQELKDFKRDYVNSVFAENLNKLYLWTEKGALLHAKSLNTDKAWAVYEILVETYFKVKTATYNIPQTYAQALRLAYEQAEQLERQELELIEARPKVTFADAVTASKTSILIGDLAKLLKQNGIDIGQNRLFEWLRQNKYLINRMGISRNMPSQKAMELGLFEVTERAFCNPFDDLPLIKATPKVTGKGQLYFINLFKNKKNT